MIPQRKTQITLRYSPGAINLLCAYPLAEFLIVNLSISFADQLRLPGIAWLGAYGIGYFNLCSKYRWSRESTSYSLRIASRHTRYRRGTRALHLQAVDSLLECD